jgi:hypothetical protein
LRKKLLKQAYRVLEASSVEDYKKNLDFLLRMSQSFGDNMRKNWLSIKEKTKT